MQSREDRSGEFDELGAESDEWRGRHACGAPRTGVGKVENESGFGHGARKRFLVVWTNTKTPPGASRTGANGRSNDE